MLVGLHVPSQFAAALVERLVLLLHRVIAVLQWVAFTRQTETLQNKQRLELPQGALMKCHERLYITLYEREQAEVLARHELKRNYEILPMMAVKDLGSFDTFTPRSLGEIF